MSAADDMPLVRTVDLRELDGVDSAMSAVEALFAPPERMLVVLAQPRFGKRRIHRDRDARGALKR
ncbi:MAG: hypothetical protein WDN76_06880 [Alphaproteobacteria bacterium]